MKINTIGIAGQLAAGKTTVAENLVEIIAWKKTSFAFLVKKIFMDAFGLESAFVEKWKRITNPPVGFNLNVRKALQLIGDGFRQIKENVWIERVFQDKSPKIIDDVRYINEAKAIKDAGGVNVLLWRPGFENDDECKSESQLKPIINHFIRVNSSGGVNIKDGPPGTELFDYFLINNMTLSDLKRNTERMYNNWLSAKLNS